MNNKAHKKAQRKNKKVTKLLKHNPKLFLLHSLTLFFYGKIDFIQIKEGTTTFMVG